MEAVELAFLKHGSGKERRSMLTRGRILAVAALVVICLALAACDVVTVTPIPVTGVAATVTPASVGGELAVVTWVIDGDTIDVEINGQTYRVRYIGINSPERDETCYTEARLANADFVEGQVVRLVRDVSETDRYGRLLRYVYAGETFVNAELVAQGYAEAVEYPPDTSFADFFASLEGEARAAGLGCHPTGVFDGR